MAKSSTEKGPTQRIRVFGSTYDRLRKRVLSGNVGTLFSEVVEDIEKKATSYEKLMRAGKTKNSSAK